MTITELAEMVGRPLEVVRYPGRWQASMRGAEVKEGPILAGAFGRGATPEEALADYAGRIAGKTIVFDAYTDKRQTINVPAEVTT